MISEFSSNRIFRNTFLISLLIHTIVLFEYPSLNITPIKEHHKIPETVYLKQQTETAQKKIHEKKAIKSLSRQNMSKNIPPPYVSKESILQKNKPLIPKKNDFFKPMISKPDIVAVKRKISIPPIDLNKIDNPSYISYYQIVREKIRRAAYQNYTKNETGEICISFLIAKNGSLIDSKLIDNKSTPSPYLKRIALQSVKNAASFPPFPKELDYPQLSFNVIISFEME